MSEHPKTPTQTTDLELYAAFSAAPRGARSAVARRLRVTPAYIANVIDGRTTISPRQRARIFDALAELDPSQYARELQEAMSPGSTRVHGHGMSPDEVLRHVGGES